jgi:hypothetical protein
MWPELWFFKLMAFCAAKVIGRALGHDNRRIKLQSIDRIIRFKAVICRDIGANHESAGRNGIE